MTGVTAPLRHSPFRLLLAGRVTSMLGNSVAGIALAFAVLDLTGSVSALGVVVGARSVANVAFLLVGGVVADRLPRHLVLVGSSALSGLSQALVAALVLTHSATVPLLVVLAAFNGVVSAFTFPASSALTPQTVPPEFRQQANAILRLGMNTAMIAGASLGGVVVAVVGSGWGLAFDAASFLVAGGFFAALRIPGVRTSGARRESTWHELREGWHEFVSRRWVWVVVAAFAFVNAAVVGGMMVLGPAVADDTIGRTGWGVVLGAQTAGMVVGGLVAMRLRLRRLLLFGVACVLPEALVLVALAVTPTVAALVVAGFVNGLAIEQFGVAWETSVQQHVPPDRLARVYSYDMLGSFIAIPAGEMVIGPIAGAVGRGTTLLGAAAVVVLATAAMLASRSVRTLESTDAADEATVVAPTVASASAGAAAGLPGSAGLAGPVGLAEHD